MNSELPSGLTDCLLWSEELGIGYHPRPAVDYASSYFENYKALDNTSMGVELTAARIEFVRKHFSGVVLDVGIGGGLFVSESDSLGYDINKEAVNWLGDRYCDPYREKVKAISCWDSLEHIPNPEALLKQVMEWLFVSMPVYLDQRDCLNSKHFKPGEHIWYWTEKGFIDWCKQQGFRLVSTTKVESEIGREGITSFAFKRAI